MFHHLPKDGPKELCAYLLIVSVKNFQTLHIPVTPKTDSTSQCKKGIIKFSNITMENQKKQPLRTQHLIVLSIIFVSLASFLLLDETFPDRFSKARFLAKLSDEGPGLSPL